MAKRRKVADGSKPSKEGFQKGNHSLNPDRPRTSKQTHLRDKSTIKRLLMYKNCKPIRDRKGKIIKAAPFQQWLPSGAVARVAPNQKWFINSRTITQNALQNFQEALGKAINDPYQVVMNQTKLPITLLNEKAKHERMHILEVEDFKSTFGPKAHRKRPNISENDLSQLVESAQSRGNDYILEKDESIVKDEFVPKDEMQEPIMKKGRFSSGDNPSR